MQTVLRKATPEDVVAMVDLSERKRLEYQQFQPVFWRKAEDSRQKQIPFFEHLLHDEQTIAYVYEQAGALIGFIIARLQPAPPVYNPGGLTCMVDDFVVAEPDNWDTIGVSLLDEVNRVARERGAVQTVVVCGHLDMPKRGMLNQDGYSIASEWYVKTLTRNE